MSAHPYDEFLNRVVRALCPLCGEKMSDDGCDSNAVWVNEHGYFVEWYGDEHSYPHQTMACRSHHHFKVVDGKFGRHIEELDGVSRGWVLHDLEGIGR